MNRSMTSIIGGSFQIQDLPGFSRVNGAAGVCEQHQWITVMQNLYTALALSTFIWSKLPSPGRPQGWLASLKGFGSGAPLALSSLLTLWFLAREAVPHGGAMCEYAVLFNSSKTSSCWVGSVRSFIKSGMRMACLLPCQSTPVASNPLFQSAWLRPPLPAQISNVLGRFRTIISEALVGRSGLRGFCGPLDASLLAAFSGTWLSWEDYLFQRFGKVSNNPVAARFKRETRLRLKRGCGAGACLCPKIASSTGG